MNSNSDQEELTKLSLLLEKTVEANNEEIISLKSELGLTNDKITLLKSKIDFYKRHIEELMIEIEKTKWNQTKAKTLFKAHTEYVENFKIEISSRTEPQIDNKEDNSMDKKLSDLKEEKEKLEMQCSIRYNILQGLLNDYKKLEEECEIHEANKYRHKNI